MEIDIQKACQLLSQGELVAIPTDTLYGLAVSVKHLSSLKKIYNLKDREEYKPILILTPDLQSVRRYFNILMKPFFDKANLFWPGALSLILPSCLNGFETLGIRIPNHPIALKILQETGPLFVSSANYAGKTPASNLLEIEHRFGKDFPTVDGGEVLGIASSIIMIKKNKPYLLREGALSFQILSEVFWDLKR